MSICTICHTEVTYTTAQTDIGIEDKCRQCEFIFYLYFYTSTTHILQFITILNNSHKLYPYKPTTTLHLYLHTSNKNRYNFNI